MRVDCCQTSVPADERLNKWLSWCHGFVDVAHQWDYPNFKALKLSFYSSSLIKCSGRVRWAVR